MRVQVVPNDVYLFVRDRERHALHEGDQVNLGAPVAAFCQRLAAVDIQCGDQRLSAMADVFEFTTTQPARRRRASRMLALNGLNSRLLINAEHHCVSGRLAVQLADHIDLFAKGRIRTV